MQIAVLGTGTVGRTIATKLVSLGHAVRMGARSADNSNAAAWVEASGPLASAGSFADAAAFGELVFNCTNGVGSLDALNAAGAQALAGKILIDVANPLDFSKGFPPTLTVTNTDSLAEQIQRAFPQTRVVKSLNTMNAALMVDPGRVPGDHDVFVAGDDPEACAQVSAWLSEWFGWKSPIQLKGIRAARGLEGWLPLWVTLYGAMGSPDFNLKIVRGGR